MNHVISISQASIFLTESDQISPRRHHECSCNVYTRTVLVSCHAVRSGQSDFIIIQVMLEQICLRLITGLTGKRGSEVIIRGGFRGVADLEPRHAARHRLGAYTHPLLSST